ncbi:MAG TPA: biotin/lipoyl-containing protein, partial [Pseudolysinimonas sp.]|nr:biotin/lipoyl-containing protein [Pseudolysinimonas sp.]
VIEEAPSVLLDDAARARIGQAAVETAKSVDYRGAGTVEFIVSADAPDEFFFMEMNTRLQVEHAVTELVTGIDIVEWQLRIAAGEPLDFGQDDVHLTGHAVEARIYAEDPATGFIPTGGRVLTPVQPEGAGVRVDSALLDGLTVTSDYDPMLAKVIAWGPDRETAMRRLQRALGDTVTHGVTTNVEFLTLLLADPDVIAGRLDTELIDRRLGSLAFRTADSTVFASAALILHALDAAAIGSSPSRAPGWRIGEDAPVRYRLRATDELVGVAIQGSAADAVVSLGGVQQRARVTVLGNVARVRLDGLTHSMTFTRHGDRLHLSQDGATWTIDDVRWQRAPSAAVNANPDIRSPMPGLVVAVFVADGEVVETGAAIASVEAMKMEYVLKASSSGTVALRVEVGSQVAADEVVASITLDGHENPPTTAGADR